MSKTNELELCYEKRTLKEALDDNKGKIIAAFSILALGAVSLILYKQNL